LIETVELPQPPPHERAAEEVNDLLYKHVVEGRLHPPVIAETLPAIVREILDTATFEDWTAVTRQLTAEARETLGSSRPMSASTSHASPRAGREVAGQLAAELRERGLDLAELQARINAISDRRRSCSPSPSPASKRSRESASPQAKSLRPSLALA
jgi:hypothetical protein